MSEITNPQIVAAIDVGSSAIRMEMTQITPDGKLRSLENLTRAVALGKDTFTRGSLSEESIQTACQALKDFAQVMKSYGVTRYRAVATSAVRESTNADKFLDRAYLRSGIDIDVIDGSEENRLTYLAIFEATRGLLDLQNRNTLIVEVGGGSTDISLLQGGKPLHSGTFALGSIRMRQAMVAVKGDLKQRIKILDRQIKNTLDVIANTIPFDQVQEVIALGGDIRFVARQILNESKLADNESWVIDRKEFNKVCTELSRYETDELVRRYHLGYAEADILLPALLAYRNIFERSKADRIHVLPVNIRAGLLLELAQGELRAGLESFNEQILASTRALATKYHSNENHIEHVGTLALSLFDQLQSEHGLGRKERLFLQIAAMLHDVGTFVSDRSHHKHSQYIIASSEIFGLSRQDLNIISNIARYHRKSPPTRSHLPYMSLDRESRMIVSKLAAILRMADALDQDYSRKVKSIKMTREDERDRYIMEVEAEGDLTMERLSLESKSDLFQEIYGKPIVLRQVNVVEAV